MFGFMMEIFFDGASFLRNMQSCKDIRTSLRQHAIFLIIIFTDKRKPMSDYRFDRTAFKMQTFKEADRANVFDKSISYAERLRQAWYLISQAYGFSMSDQPRLDRNCFSSRKLNN